MLGLALFVSVATTTTFAATVTRTKTATQVDIPAGLNPPPPPPTPVQPPVVVQPGTIPVGVPIVVPTGSQIIGGSIPGAGNCYVLCSGPSCPGNIQNIVAFNTFSEAQCQNGVQRQVGATCIPQFGPISVNALGAIVCDAQNQVFTSAPLVAIRQQTRFVVGPNGQVSQAVRNFISVLGNRVGSASNFIAAILRIDPTVGTTSAAACQTPSSCIDFAANAIALNYAASPCYSCTRLNSNVFGNSVGVCFGTQAQQRECFNQLACGARDTEFFRVGLNECNIFGVRNAECFGCDSSSSKKGLLGLLGLLALIPLCCLLLLCCLLIFCCLKRRKPVAVPVPTFAPVMTEHASWAPAMHCATAVPACGDGMVMSPMGGHCM